MPALCLPVVDATQCSDSKAATASEQCHTLKQIEHVPAGRLAQPSVDPDLQPHELHCRLSEVQMRQPFPNPSARESLVDAPSFVNKPYQTARVAPPAFSDAPFLIDHPTPPDFAEMPSFVNKKMRRTSADTLRIENIPTPPAYAEAPSLVEPNSVHSEAGCSTPPAVPEKQPCIPANLEGFKQWQIERRQDEISTDNKLAEGCYAEGWRIIPRFSTSNKQWLYISPNGENFCTRVDALGRRESNATPLAVRGSSCELAGNKEAASLQTPRRLQLPQKKLKLDRSKAFASEMCNAQLGPAWSFSARHRFVPQSPKAVSLSYVMACTTYREDQQMPSRGPAESPESGVEGERETKGEAGGLAALAPAGNEGDVGHGRKQEPSEVEDSDESEDNSAAVCGLYGCQQRHGHSGLCDVNKVARGSRTRRLPKWREQQIEEECSSADEEGSLAEGGAPKKRTVNSAGRKRSKDQSISPSHAVKTESKLQWTEASWGVLYPKSVDNDPDGKSEGSTVTKLSSSVMHDAPARWLPPPIGSKVSLPKESGERGRVDWCPHVVAYHSLHRGQLGFIVAHSGRFDYFSRAGEGRLWRRICPKKGKMIEVPIIVTSLTCT